MSDTFSGIATLMSSVRAQQMAARIISNNITNAATEGYSRELPELTESAPMYMNLQGGGRVQVGTGVQLTAIARIRDEFLDMQLRAELSVMGYQNAILTTTDQMKALFPELSATPGAGFTTYLNKVFSDFTALSLAPTSVAARQTVISDAQTFASMLNSAYQTLEGMRFSSDEIVRDDIARINILLYQVAEANKAMANAGGNDGAAAVSADQRDLALEKLASLIKIDTARMADGTMLVMAGNGRVLVEGGTVNELVESVVASSGRVGVGIRVSAGWMPTTVPLSARKPTWSVMDISGEIAGGEVAGAIASRDKVVADEELELDELASSLIEEVNTLHRAGYAADGVTTNTDFFTGINARTIAVSSTVANAPALVVASRLYGNTLNGDQAASLGMLSSLLMNTTVQSASNINGPMGPIDPTKAMNFAAHTALNGPNPFARNAVDFKVAPSANGTIVINGVSIAWSNTDSLEEIVRKINNPLLGLGVRASFDITSQKFAIFTPGPLTIYDSAGNLTRALDLQVRITSLTAMNTGIGPADQSIDPFLPLNQSLRQLRTAPSPIGTITIAGAGTPWDSGQTLDQVRLNINASLAAAKLALTFDPSTQKMTIRGYQALPATAANPISTTTPVDTAGDMAMVMNMESQPSFGLFGATLVAQMEAQDEGALALKDQAGAMVDQITAQRDAIMKVNVDEEKIRLMEYARAYEAAIRAMAVLDEMLNVLINKMAVTSSDSSSSVLSS